MAASAMIALDTATSTPAPASAAPSTHSYDTRTHSGQLIKPWELLNLHNTALDTVSLIPKSVHGALKDPNWHAAMVDEFRAHISNNTWKLVSPPSNSNAVPSKWIFRHKLKPDGSLERYKARLVLCGFSQETGVNFVKPATIRLVLSLASSTNWPNHQLDVKNGFLHDTLSETVYCRQPTGFVDRSRPDSVCRVNRSLYGLKQAHRSWY